jgi:hypothetical protein
MALKDFVSYRLESGSPIAAGDTRVTPQSQVLSIRGWNGGYVWNRPVAVLVERDGEIKRYPIVNVTRYAQIGLIAMGAILSGLFLMLRLGRGSGRK